jgi:hypothetical protein
MSLSLQSTTEEMCATTSFHTNHHLLPVRRELEELPSRELSTQNNLASRVESYYVEGGLAQIDAESGNVHDEPPHANQDSPSGVTCGGPFQ